MPDVCVLHITYACEMFVYYVLHMQADVCVLRITYYILHITYACHAPARTTQGHAQAAHTHATHSIVREHIL